MSFYSNCLYFITTYSISLNVSFRIALQLINSIVIVSGGQQRDPAIHVSILPQTSLPSRLPSNTEQSSLCYTVTFPSQELNPGLPHCRQMLTMIQIIYLSLYSRTLLVIHFKQSSVHMSIPNSVTIPFPILLLAIIISFSKSVSVFVFTHSILQTKSVNRLFKSGLNPYKIRKPVQSLTLCGLRAKLNL